MDFDKLIDGITPDICANLRRAVELGKWPDGRALTDEQKALCLQAVIAYEESHVSEENRVGFIDTERVEKKHDERCADTPTPLKWH